MNYTIHPYEGMGPLRLGMTRQEIRAILGEPESTFLKTPSSIYLTDFYTKLGLQIAYKEPEICNAIHTTDGEVKPIFQGHSIADEPFSNLRDWFQEIDSNSQLDASGITSYKYGIGLYAPKHTWQPEEGLDENTDIVEGVIVFERGYYDDVEEKLAGFEAELDRRLAAGLPIDDLLAI
jgi:hypothetical protein